MNYSMYTQPKKKREVDPNAPPRPTLLGHEKEMKVWREQFGKLATTNTEQAIELAFLKRKMNRMQGQIDALVSSQRKMSR